MVGSNFGRKFVYRVFTAQPWTHGADFVLEVGIGVVAEVVYGTVEKRLKYVSMVNEPKNILKSKAKIEAKNDFIL